MVGNYTFCEFSRIMILLYPYNWSRSVTYIVNYTYKYNIHLCVGTCVTMDHCYFLSVHTIINIVVIPFMKSTKKIYSIYIYIAHS